MPGTPADSTQSVCVDGPAESRQEPGAASAVAEKAFSDASGGDGCLLPTQPRPRTL